MDAVLVLDASGSVSGESSTRFGRPRGRSSTACAPASKGPCSRSTSEVQLLQPMTTDLAGVRRALDRVFPGNTALVDAVYAALRLRELGDRRTAVVVFSDGIDNLSWLSASDVVEAAGRSNATVYG